MGDKELKNRARNDKSAKESELSFTNPVNYALKQNNSKAPRWLFSTALTLTSFAHARYTGRQLTRLIFLQFKTYPRYINVCTFLVNMYEFILTYSGSQVFNECIYKSSN